MNTPKYRFLKAMEDMELPGETPIIEDTNTIEDPEDPNKKEGAVVVSDDVTIGAESFNYYGVDLSADTTPPTMAPGGAPTSGPARDTLNIRTSDHKNFRIYFKAEHFLTEQYITRLCRFLDSRTPDQTVTFYMGCKMHSHFTMIIGAILSAVNSCPAQTFAVAAGCCGIPESFIWCFCNDRTVERYGGLTFGGTDGIKYAPFYKSYLETCFEKAMELGMLTKEEVTTLWDNNGEVLITYQDFQSRGGR